MIDFYALTPEEQQNEILKGIYNQLVQMNKFLEVGIALYGKLTVGDIFTLHINSETIPDSLGDLRNEHSESYVGYRKTRGLYSTEYVHGFTEWPLGDDDAYERTDPIDPDTGGFTEPLGEF